MQLFYNNGEINVLNFQLSKKFINKDQNLKKIPIKNYKIILKLQNKQIRKNKNFIKKKYRF